MLLATHGATFQLRLSLPANVPTELDLPVSGKLEITAGKVRRLAAVPGRLRLAVLTPQVRLRSIADIGLTPIRI